MELAYFIIEYILRGIYMKKLINHPEQVVQDMLEGIVAAHPKQYRLVPETTVLVRAEAPVSGKVGLVSGGGSGHEPSHAGFVGKGMLDGAVAGEVFTSPTPDQVFEAIKAVDSGSGVLLIIKNYTGDVMNFEMAAELAEAEGIKVAKVVVNDDVAVENSTYTTGRRGIAGTVFVHKIAGALAETGATLEEVEAVANKVIENVKSMGMALTPCTIPAAGKPGFSIGENEMEIGMGIHGEPGIERSEIATADEVAATFVEKILDDLQLPDNSKVAVMINGLGATPLMELYILNKRVAELLSERNITVHETFVGEYMTSLEMAGCSLSILHLDDDLTQLLDAEADTVGFKK
jgi:phosphoenolpyruvate---glycerone phosphotransferase subunit DhaK